MATIKFGSSIEASCQAHVKVSTLNEELVDNDDTNPARLVPCPFDKSHQIRICRFPYHIIKCKKNHPQLAKQMKTCSFNACHVMPKHELDEHTKTCPNRIALFTEEDGGEKCRKWELPASSHAPITPDPSEDWEKEADETVIPFIWGESSLACKLPV
ncbi:gametocyte-specific factor 1 isoform X2 [Stigmatopora nigra]